VAVTSSPKISPQALTSCPSAQAGHRPVGRELGRAAGVQRRDWRTGSCCWSRASAISGGQRGERFELAACAVPGRDARDFVGARRAPVAQLSVRQPATPPPHRRGRRLPPDRLLTRPKEDPPMTATPFEDLFPSLPRIDRDYCTSALQRCRSRVLLLVTSNRPIADTRVSEPLTSKCPPTPSTAEDHTAGTRCHRVDKGHSPRVTGHSGSRSANPRAWSRGVRLRFAAKPSLATNSPTSSTSSNSMPRCSLRHAARPRPAQLRRFGG
jgi:hypothetical protein